MLKKYVFFRKIAYNGDVGRGIMLSINTNSSLKNEANISLTAYRALFILALLMSKPYTRDELIKELKGNPLTCKSVSVDTIRVTINTLKLSGCKISRPTRGNNYTYNLLSHPFCFDFSDEEIEVLNCVRKNISMFADWSLCFDINDFYENILFKVLSEQNVLKLKNSITFSDVDKNILEFLAKPSSFNKEVILTYDSVENGLCDLRVVVNKIFKDKGDLYLWCYSHKYDDYSYLRLDRIKGYKKIQNSNVPQLGNNPIVVKYAVVGDSLLSFQLYEKEQIIKKTDKIIIVEAVAYSEFYMLQRLLSFGRDFFIISPESYKQKILDKIDLMSKEYCQ